IEQQICRRRHRIGKRGEISNAANLLQHILISQTLLDGNQVNPLSFVVHFREYTVYRLITKIIKYFLPSFELLDAFSHRIIWREKNAPQDSFFSLRGVGRKTVHCMLFLLRRPSATFTPQIWHL